MGVAMAMDEGSSAAPEGPTTPEDVAGILLAASL